MIECGKMKRTFCLILLLVLAKDLLSAPIAEEMKEARFVGSEQIKKNLSDEVPSSSNDKLQLDLAPEQASDKANKELTDFAAEENNENTTEFENFTDHTSTVNFPYTTAYSSNGNTSTDKNEVKKNITKDISAGETQSNVSLNITVTEVPVDKDDEVTSDQTRSETVVNNVGDEANETLSTDDEDKKVLNATSDHDFFVGEDDENVSIKEKGKEFYNDADNDKDSLINNGDDKFVSIDKHDDEDASLDKDEDKDNGINNDDDDASIDKDENEDNGIDQDDNDKDDDDGDKDDDHDEDASTDKDEDKDNGINNDDDDKDNRIDQDDDDDDEDNKIDQDDDDKDDEDNRIDQDDDDKADDDDDDDVSIDKNDDHDDDASIDQDDDDDDDDDEDNRIVQDNDDKDDEDHDHASIDKDDDEDNGIDNDDDDVSIDKNDDHDDDASIDQDDDDDDDDDDDEDNRIVQDNDDKDDEDHDHASIDKDDDDEDNGIDQDDDDVSIDKDDDPDDDDDDASIDKDDGEDNGIDKDDDPDYDDDASIDKDDGEDYGIDNDDDAVIDQDDDDKDDDDDYASIDKDNDEDNKIDQDDDDDDDASTNKDDDEDNGIDQDDDDVSIDKDDDPDDDDDDASIDKDDGDDEVVSIDKDDDDEGVSIDNAKEVVALKGDDEVIQDKGNHDDVSTNTENKDFLKNKTSINSSTDIGVPVDESDKFFLPTKDTFLDEESGSSDGSTVGLIGRNCEGVGEVKDNDKNTSVDSYQIISDELDCDLNITSSQVTKPNKVTKFAERKEEASTYESSSANDNDGDSDQLSKLSADDGSSLNANNQDTTVNDGSYVSGGSSGEDIFTNQNEAIKITGSIVEKEVIHSASSDVDTDKNPLSNSGAELVADYVFPSSKKKGPFIDEESSLSAKIYSGNDSEIEKVNSADGEVEKSDRLRKPFNESSLEKVENFGEDGKLFNKSHSNKDLSFEEYPKEKNKRDRQSLEDIVNDGVSGGLSNRKNETDRPEKANNVDDVLPREEPIYEEFVQKDQRFQKDLGSNEKMENSEEGSGIHPKLIRMPRSLRKLQRRLCKGEVCDPNPIIQISPQIPPFLPEDEPPYHGMKERMGPSS